MTINWEIIASIPWWFYAILIIVLRTTYKATHARIVPIRNIFMLPFAYVIYACFLQQYLPPFNVRFLLTVDVPIMIIAMLLSITQCYVNKMKAIPHETKLYMPGSWLPFILFCILLSAPYKYGIIYSLYVHPETLTQPQLSNGISFYLFMATGFCLGRLIYALRLIKVGPYHTAQI